MKSRTAYRVLVVAVVLSASVGGQPPPFKPVTDAMLRNPSPGDWLHFRRTYDAWGYSPLGEINRRTVGRLQLAWAWAMEPGTQQPTPLVYDGVMYLPNPGNVVHALDAATGDLLWEYRYEPSAPQRGDAGRGAGGRGAAQGRGAGGAGGGGNQNARPVRNLAIYDDKVFMTTGDAHAVALDARTGKVVWNVAVADASLGFTAAAGPVAVPGKIITSLSGCSRYGNEKCAIVALDARTGKELWRTLTVPRPGDAGSNTWGDLPFEFRAGTEMWIAGSYDPEQNLVLWSTAQAKPWTRFQRGTDGDALFSNSVLALNADTGKIVWYHQFVPGETQDMDDVFESISIDSGSQKALFKMGKLGILWQLDRRTGKYLNGTDLGYQDIVRLDTGTGTVTYRPEKIPQPNTELSMCPDLTGVRAQWAMSYSPETRAFYIPLQLVCAKVVFGEPGERVVGRGGGGGATRKFELHPASGGNLGEFVALDVNGKILWRRKQRATMMTAALTTAGGLAFVGDYERYLRAFDVKTGAVLWQTRTATSPHGFPISYAVRGKQYLAVSVGVGGGSWSTTIPAQLTPEIKTPNTGNALYVFALPETIRPAR
jgi:alcohol dehydrogenase (cytochrome c)